MAQAQLDIGGTSLEAQRSIDKLTKKVSDLTERMRTMKAESKRGAAESISDQNSLAGSLTKTVALVGTLGGITAKVYSDWSARMEGLRGDHEKFAGTLTKTVAELGRLKDFPQVQQWLNSLGAKGVTREIGTAAFQGVGKGGGLSLERTEAIAEEVAKMGPALGPEGVASLGDLANAVAKQAPGMKAGAVGDTATALRRMLGPDKAAKLGSDAFQRQMLTMRESGMSELDVLAHATVAADRDVKGNALELLNPIGRLSHEDRQRRAQVFQPEEIARAKRELALAQIGQDLNVEAAATPGSALGANARQLLRDENIRKMGPGLGTLKNVQDTMREANESRGGIHGQFESAIDSFNRGIDALIRFARIETPEGQATSLATAAERSGLISTKEKNDLLAELQEQTRIMRDEKGKPRVNLDTHVE